jgi:VanZ family protein
LFKFLEKNKKLLVYTPLVVYWIVLFGATTLPAASMPSFGVVDKVNHLSAYFILAILLFLTLLFQQKIPLAKNKVAAYALIICSLYGMLDEVHQIFIPGRSAEFLDLFADILGAGLGVLFMIILVKRSGYKLK